MLGLLIIALVVGGLAFRHYLDTKPAELADQYRKDTAREFAQATDAMDRTYASFDHYLDVFTLPRSVVRNANDIQGLKRRFLPVYEETATALDRAKGSIKNARGLIAKSKRALAKKVPEARFVKDADELKEARAARSAGKRYLSRSETYLKTYERFVKYDTEAVKLRRRDLLNLAEHETDPDASLEATRANYAAALANEKKILEADLKLKPPPDLERLHDLDRETYTISVDLYEDLVKAIDDLSIAEFDAAGKNALDAFKGQGDKEIGAVARFISRSKLQLSSFKLAKAATTVEKQFAKLGTGSASDLAADSDRRRAKPPPPPKRSGGKDKKGNLS